MLKHANDICKEIENSGFQALIVGGTVRDILLGLEPHDIDIATNMPISKLEKIFQCYDIGKSKDFGIVVVNADGFQFEIAQFRSDGNYTDGRKPDTIKTVSSFKKDASRRDFTINAMGLRQDGKILDHFNGIKDLNNKIICTVGNPVNRFTEDKLRILRAVRFATKLNFTIEKNTKKVIKSMSKTICSLTPERIKDELCKAGELGGKKFATYIKTLDKLKLLREILPEIAALKYKPEVHGHHPESNNTFGHVIKALESSNSKNPLELLAILFHDVGKGVTQGIKNNSSHHTYYNHDNVGSELVKDIGKRLKFSNKEIDMFVFTTENHMRFHRIMEMKPSKVAKLASHINFKELVIVCEADSLDRRSCLPMLARVKKIMQNNSTKIVSKLVTGNLIMELLNIQPGKEVGRIKKLVGEKIINENIVDKDVIKNLILKEKKNAF